MSRELKTISRDDDYQRLYDTEEQKERLSTPRLTIIKETSVSAIKLGGTFTFSALLPLLLAMLGNIQNSDVPDADNSLNRAAATFSVTGIEIGVTTLIYATLPTLFVGGNLFAQIQDLKTMEEQKISFKKDFSRLIKTSLLFAFLPTLLSMGTLFFSGYILVNWFGQDEKVSAITEQFLRPMSFLMPLYTLRFCLQPLFYIHNEMKSMTFVSLFSFFAFGIFLTEGLGFGHFSLPAKGILGIFFGMMAENIFTTVGLAACLFSKSFKDYRFSASFLSFDSDDYKQFFDLADKGIPLILTYLSELFTIFIKNVLAGLLGTPELAVQDISGQVWFIFLFVAHAYSQGTALGISKAQGGNKSRFARYGLLISFLASLIPFLIVISYPQVLTILANSDTISDEVMSLTGKAVRWAAGASVINTLALTMLQSLRMMTNHRKPTIAFNAWLWISVALSYLLGFTAKLGVIGIGIGSFLGIGMGTLHIGSYWGDEFPNETSAPEEKRQLNLQIDSNPEPVVSSSWWGCFLRPMNRLRNWYTGTENTVHRM